MLGRFLGQCSAVAGEATLPAGTEASEGAGAYPRSVGAGAARSWEGGRRGEAPGRLGPHSEAMAMAARGDDGGRWGEGLQGEAPGRPGVSLEEG